MGWEPNIVLTTTISQIELAIEGKIDYVRKTNPFGSGEETEEEKMKKMVNHPETAAKQIVEMVKTRQIMRNRMGKKLGNK